MYVTGKTIGVALTGSFCTYAKIWPELQKLKDQGANLIFILSEHAASIKSRFGKPADFLEQIRTLTDTPPILTIEDAEPIGPQSLLDILVIFPCTGNTAAKLACGITDTPVLMAAKAHLRNEKPLVLSLSTNDALGMNMKNIGLLLNTRHIYFLPFGQDDPVKKPNSMTAHTSLLIPALEAALEGRQYQPVILSPKTKERKIESEGCPCAE
ncbi:MAG: dipicolinate synthase subunit B [Clostridiales bacterium]|nr:dipicolinate synthase subunit B [Clostridiales bacterium]